MKAIKNLLWTVAAILAMNINIMAQSPAAKATCYALTLPKQDLSQEEKQWLIDMRQEEKLAHDVYYTLYEKWNLPVFNNIAKSEAVHTQRIKDMINKYGLQDPVSDAQLGVFSDKKYSDLYKKLVEQGSRSLKDALIVGATIEDLDIHDLNKALSQTDNDDLTIVFTALKRGSYHHMRAFTRLLKRMYDYQYTPQYISQDEFNQILTQQKKNPRRLPKK